MEPKVGPLAADPDPNCPKAPPVLVELEADIMGFCPKAGGDPKGWPDKYLIVSFLQNILQYQTLPPKLGAPPKVDGLVGVFCCWTAKPEDATFPQAWKS